MSVLLERVPYQFDIASHYDVMAQLDQDVHDDVALAQSEVDVALRLIGFVPNRVFLPCFGTGRHIPALLSAGVTLIGGVDLSEACVQKARTLVGDDPRVCLVVGDILEYQPDTHFDAVLLLGNSFGDIVDPTMLRSMAQSVVRPLRKGGAVVMDYIGSGYECQYGHTTTWNAMLHGRCVRDERTPVYDAASGIMTIHVVVYDTETNKEVWKGYYQKRVLPCSEVGRCFAPFVEQTIPCGRARDINPYYACSGSELGMIAQSTWWVGRRS